MYIYIYISTYEYNIIINKYVYIKIQPPHFIHLTPELPNHLGVRIARGGAEDQAADAAEAVDSHTFEEAMRSSTAGRRGGSVFPEKTSRFEVEKKGQMIWFSGNFLMCESTFFVWSF